MLMTNCQALRCLDESECGYYSSHHVCCNIDSHMCQCKHGSDYDNDLHLCYIKNNTIGGSCFYEKDCSSIHNATCHNKTTCACKTGFEQGVGNKTCLKVLKRLGEPCEENIQCSRTFGNNSHCHEVCLCNDNFHKVNNTKCLEKRGEGKNCTSEVYCYEERRLLDCVEGICKPPVEHMLRHGEIESSNPISVLGGTGKKENCTSDGEKVQPALKGDGEIGYAESKTVAERCKGTCNTVSIFLLVSIILLQFLAVKIE